MPIEVRPFRDDDIVGLVHADFRAFGVSLNEADAAVERLKTGFELDRFVVACDGDEIVGNGGAYTMELTLPGGAMAAVSGVTWIGVQPTHRRRGVMKAVMDALVADARARGEVAMVLIAAEGSIYSNVGYGIGTQWRHTSINTRRAEVRADVPITGRLRFVDPDDALAAVGPIHERFRAHTPGELTRSDAWWRGHVTEGPKRTTFYVVHEDEHGVADGYVTYQITERWGNLEPGHLCELGYFAASTPDAHAALWNFMLSLDLVSQIETFAMAPDDPLPLLVDDPRQIRTVDLTDAVWVRLLDAGAWFRARRYAVAEELVIEVSGAVPSVSGRWRITGSPDHAECVPSTSPADVVMTPETLSSVALGASSVTQYARAGRITEATPGAVARLARFLRWEPLPYSGTNF
jgi:predicted acetyltransferase